MGVQPGLVGECPTLAVEWHHVEVLRQIDVPALVGLAHGDEPGRVGQPRRLRELEVTRGEVPRGTESIGRDDVDVLWAIGRPSDPVELREVVRDAPRRLVRRLVVVVAVGARARAERDEAPVGRPHDLAHAVPHDRHRDDFARAVHREDVERGVLLLLTARRRERQRAAVGRPHRPAVLVTAGQWPRRTAGRVVQPHLADVSVAWQIDAAHGERDPSAIW